MPVPGRHPPAILLPLPPLPPPFRQCCMQQAMNQRTMKDVTPFMRQKHAATMPQAVPMVPNQIGPPIFVIIRLAGTCIVASVQQHGQAGRRGRGQQAGRQQMQSTSLDRYTAVQHDTAHEASPAY